MKSEYIKFKQRVYVTKCARFEAYRRMKRRKISSTVSLALLSISIIYFNVIQLCTKSGFEKYGEAITAVTIMLSVLVLALSLLVSYLNYSEREHKYYDCAMRLSNIGDRLDLTMCTGNENEMTLEKLNQFTNDYERILGECGVNHIAIDYKRAIERVKDGDTTSSQVSIPDKTCLWIEWNILDVNFLYWVLAFIIPIVSGILIFNTTIFRSI